MKDFDSFSCTVLADKEHLQSIEESYPGAEEEVWAEEMTDHLRCILQECLGESSHEIEVEAGLDIAGKVEFNIRIIGLSVADHETVRAALGESEILDVIDDEGCFAGDDDDDEDTWWRGDDDEEDEDEDEEKEGESFDWRS